MTLVSVLSKKKLSSAPGAGKLMEMLHSRGQGLGGKWATADGKW
jgi:hypothetical protein